MTTDAPMVRVVVVNYDGGLVTLRCIDSLLATEHPADRLEIVVVDNASVDGLVWILAEQYPTVRVIVSDTNEGFARGCNLAMRDLEGVDYVALINNDAIVEPGWLAPLLETCAPDGVGAVCPKLLLNVWARAVQIEAPIGVDVDGNMVGVGVEAVRISGVDVRHEVRFDERFWNAWESDGEWPHARWTKRSPASFWWVPDDLSVADGDQVEIEFVAPAATAVSIGDGDSSQTFTLGRGRTTVTVPAGPLRRIINSAGGQLYAGWHGGDRGFLEPDLGQYDEPCEVFAWCGGAVVLKADYLREVGIFDDTYFLYYEDFDLSWRGRSAGWTYWYDPRSVVLHEHAYSSKAGSDFFTFWVDRNRRLTLVKNAPLSVACRALVGSGLGFARATAQHTRMQWQRRRPPSPTWMRTRVTALGRVWSGVPSALRERRRIAKASIVDRATIARWTVTK